jgi:hypothetical protein
MITGFVLHNFVLQFYYVVLGIIMFFNVGYGIARVTYLPTYSKYFKAKGYNLESTTKQYIIGMIISLGGFAVPILVDLIIFIIYR